MIDEKPQDERDKATQDFLRRGSMDTPEDAIAFPVVEDLNNQVKQLREQATARPASTFTTPRSLVTSPSVPKPVGGISVLREAVPGTSSVKIHVSFTRDPKDTAFQKANVYLQQGNGKPVLMATTEGEQATSFVTAKTNMASTVVVQSVGNSNILPLEHSPSRVVSLGGTVGAVDGKNGLPGSGGTEAPTVIPSPVGVPPYFQNILTGTNTTATMTVGTGAKLNVSGTGVVEATELATNTATPVVVDGNAPTHPGQLLISQPGNASAMWADPQVQGLYAEGNSIISPPAYTPPTTIQPILIGVQEGDNLYALRSTNVFKTYQAQGGTPLQVGIWTPASGKKFRMMKLWLSISGNANTTGGALMTIYLTDGPAGPVVGPTFDVWIQPPTTANAAGFFDGLLFNTGLIDMGNGYLSSGANTTLYLNANVLLSTGYIRVNTFGAEE